MTKHEPRCCLCGGVCERIGNNPYPLSQSGRCCDACNEVVIEARINPKAIEDERIRVSQAIWRMPRAPALAAICAARGPDLLAKKKHEQEQFAALKERLLRPSILDEENPAQNSDPKN
jgi:hypothetical protein